MAHLDQQHLYEADKNCITKKNFAIKFLSKQNFEYSSVNVNSVCKVKRSKYMQMNVNKFERKFNFKMPHVEKEIMKDLNLLNDSLNKILS